MALYTTVQDRLSFLFAINRLRANVKVSFSLNHFVNLDDWSNKRFRPPDQKKMVEDFKKAAVDFLVRKNEDGKKVIVNRATASKANVQIYILGSSKEDKGEDSITFQLTNVMDGWRVKVTG